MLELALNQTDVQGQLNLLRVSIYNNTNSNYGLVSRVEYYNVNSNNYFQV